MTETRARVVIIGAGFGGLYAARTLEKQADIDVLLIDRNNYHTFTPLLYQVATSGLEAEEIAYPVRGIFRKKSNVRFLLGSVTGIDTDKRIVIVQTSDSERHESYDYLIVAAGSVTNFFGSADVEANAFELKSLTDAIHIRNHLLTMFERAAWEPDDGIRFAYTTIVVVGGGPSGLETAGAMRELYKHVLDKEFGGLTARVILVEATDRLLAPYPERLRDAAKRQLESLGVEVVLNDPVESAGEDYVKLKSGRIIPSYTLVWVAGVSASPTAHLLNVPTARNGRVVIEPTAAVKNLDGVYAVGDAAYLEDDNGQPYPMLIPVAKQQVMLAGRNIIHQIRGEPLETFRYIDRGTMATIGRSRAVAWLFYRVQLTGYFAWVSWLGLHLLTLMGFRNRLNVLTNWVWNYLTFDRSVRIILHTDKSQSTETTPLEIEPISDLVERR